jgi:hypothetical protein
MNLLTKDMMPELLSVKQKEPHITADMPRNYSNDNLRIR